MKEKINELENKELLVYPDETLKLLAIFTEVESNILDQSRIITDQLLQTDLSTIDKITPISILRSFHLKHYVRKEKGCKRLFKDELFTQVLRFRDNLSKHNLNHLEVELVLNDNEFDKSHLVIFPKGEMGKVIKYYKSKRLEIHPDENYRIRVFATTKDINVEDKEINLLQDIECFKEGDITGTKSFLKKMSQKFKDASNDVISSYEFHKKHYPGYLKAS